MISIIIPTRNEESILEKTLKNFKEKITIPHEIIISDGKSTDRTLEIARKYADKVIEADPNKKQNIAIGRNIGAAAATGDYLVFFDADCHIMNPDEFFTKAVAHFENGANNHTNNGANVGDDAAKKPARKTSAVVTNIRVLPEMETRADKGVMSVINWWYGILNNTLHIGMAGGEFQMMRHADFTTLGGYNEDLVASEDVEMMTRLAKLGWTRLDRSLTVYHTGRRAHKVGWPKLLWQWFTNMISMIFRGKAASSEWEVIR